MRLLKVLSRYTAALISLALAAPALAANYYVRPTGDCTNNGDGTAYDCAASPGGAGAWKGFSNITIATLDGSSHTLFIAGTHGTVWNRTRLNGTSDSERLKIYSCTTANGCGTEDPGVIDGGVEGANFSGTCMYLNACYYITVKGLELKRSWGEKGLKVDSGSYNLTFDGLSVHDNRDLGVGFNLANPAVRPHDIILENSSVYNNGSEGIYVIKMDDVTIRNNTVYANGTGNAYFGSGTGANGEGDGIEIKPECTGAIVEGNTVYNPDYDGNTDVYAIHGYAEGTIIRNNYIHSLGTNEHGIRVGANNIDYGVIVGEDITAMYIYNNLIVDDETPSASGIITRVDGTHTSTGLQFLNNTIVGCQNGIRYTHGTYDTTASIIKNNVISTPAGTSYAITLDNSVNVANSIAESDYNDIYDPDGTGTNVYSIAGTGRTFAYWQANYFAEANSIQSDPSLDGTYEPEVGSPVIDEGVSLAAIFTTDKSGTTRPEGSAWDMGVYEYSSGSPPAGSGGLTLGSGGTMSIGSGGTITLQ